MDCAKKIENFLRIEAFDLSRKKKKYDLGHLFPNIYLTHREAQCMCLFIKGFSNQAASKALNFSTQTIEFYLKNLKNKLSCNSKKKLVEQILLSDFLQSIDSETAQAS